MVALSCVLSLPPLVVDVEREKGTPGVSAVMVMTPSEAEALMASTRLGLVLMVSFSAIGSRGDEIAIDGVVVGCNDVGDINVVDGGGDGVACFVRAG